MTSGILACHGGQPYLYCYYHQKSVLAGVQGMQQLMLADCKALLKGTSAAKLCVSAFA